MVQHRYYMLKKNSTYPRTTALIKKTNFKKPQIVSGRQVWGVVIYKKALPLYDAFIHALIKEEYKDGVDVW